MIRFSSYIKRFSVSNAEVKWRHDEIASKFDCNHVILRLTNADLTENQNCILTAKNMMNQISLVNFVLHNSGSV